MVETAVSTLRKKLDCLGPQMRHTVRQAGYVLCDGASHSADSE